ncbi:M13 family metallopeptidase [Flavobacterium litorale]|uniref:M13 family metallopeptidase n=1 Tax=Flavobacterium litorale TaxID=2856519 RepID=A0ABX8V8L1_9FLAO|nr:M13 family metallopeptidase [Flavobacterium litorale]QYJ69155.1 M13 family metallopeptidase [Flavobacterium litorale]
MKLNKKATLATLAIVLGATVCNGQTKSSKQTKPGINLSYMDTSVKPSEDFFRFVNGKWLDNTEIPGDKTRWGSFDELREQTNHDALVILKEAAADKTLNPNSDQGKAASLYRAIMDTVARNQKGIEPLEPYLVKIDRVRNLSDLQKLITEMEVVGGIGFFNSGVGADAKDSNRNAVYIMPGSLGLPDRDYYVSDDKDSQEKRDKYIMHVAHMLRYVGYNKTTAEKAAKSILEFETAMATPRLDRVERRDSRKTYNPMSVAQLQELMPVINWNSYLSGIGITKVDTVIVSQPKYMDRLAGLLNENKVDDWKHYMKWTLLNSSTSQLTTNIETDNWRFYSQTLRGALKEEKREINALRTINGTVGEALGKLYVAKKFPAEAKQKAESMIANVMLAFENRINKLPWMAKSTRKNAIEKLRKLRIKIGYPDKWKDYSALTITSPEAGGDLFTNMKNIARFNHNKDMAKLHRPVNKDEWYMAPQIVNAYFNPSYNEIVFPAAILQPPFYDYKADEAVNYGGIGAVIGHEISHGFDDSGSRYNADGNLVNWWSNEDLEKFTGLGGALASQYSQLQPLPGTYVDGEFTLGENIGDLGGVNAAYDGLQIYLEKNGRPGLIDGYTPEQRFFISWATIWRTKMRDEAIKNQVKTDPHSPAMYRAYVPLQNVDAFYEAFDIKKGDGMYINPEERVKIW